ncbi:putative metal-dependent peptidase [Abditibacterium utsteinense]|uniref:Putative metal-dependent peptidase n=1 Tax=Abditibacterium utsteinense TaxID=1960156 RepID=A0A2S8SPP9_9BACT|nr:VWA-like domain-containing protein [Abditibacterium utsteinense]PQV62768.1 putative metal-dependent peptidase [Abditibacterium utsteinense]
MNEKSRELATLARYCVTKSPGFAAIALWVPYFASETTDFVAFTDGKKVVAGEKFWSDFVPLERAFILCHEILHVALRHVPRGAAAYRVSGAHGKLWNIACDAVINHALSKMSWLQAPENGVAIERVLKRDLLEKRPAASWSAEAIFAQLVEQIGAANQGETPEEKIKEWLDAQGFDAPDMLPDFSGDAENNGQGGGEMESRIWASRLSRAQAGDRPGGLLRALSGDFPTSQTPWPQVLRAFLQDATMPQSRENWNRPSRRVLSGTSPVFEPATQPEMGIRRAGIVIDTSGSISDALLTRFCAEISAVQRRTGCEIVLLSADSKVQSEVRVKNEGRALIERVHGGEVELKGGGGTDFAPALRRLNELEVSIALYFTDLRGAFGTQKPAMPLLWCTPTPKASAPFGRVIWLDKI